ncbi:uncharacterized protein Z518_10323 [Rhinocladiella mackenziei CBS 650.93]|uniref:Rab-GAP TBC domain-containing protein n=1 Tax=Rhinocladiella mackenziei CBS 650.93 TaxID=1442369 RepID=A0A0D2ITW4_9EURO|nr:uncharacterized protein Z518_10323 [Rhinocladiella mackenziei CBS 650.93]KIX00185.1 hypothetical protein Z518_10323 [Rhinocladiella mackenziei CBS 650.93]
MEEPLTRPAFPYIQYSSSTGAGPASCQLSASSSSIPPIVPGAGPLETLPLGAHQASTLEFAGLDQVILHHDNALWRISTLVSPDSTRLERTEITLRSRANTHDYIAPNNNSRPPEINCPPLAVDLLETSKNDHQDRDILDELSPNIAQDSRSRIRSLTSLPNARILTMTTATTSAPGSPPDLSGSRSSKSSSYSSTFSGPDGLESDIINFEEIGLEDEKHTPSGSYHVRDISVQSVSSQHELMKAKESGSREKRPTLPQLQTQVRISSQRQESMPPRAMGSRMAAMKRGFTSPESFYPSNARTRSSSPPNRRALASASTTSLSSGGLRPIPQSPATSLGLPSRRASWQPHRKTVKELEAEYHDSDDELPDDASLWNVPVSPFPSGPSSHRSSFRGSPERDQPAQSPRPIPLAHAKTAPETPPRPTLHSQTLPKNRPPPPRAVSLNVSASNPSSPRQANHLRDGRTKSWNLAVADLSEEAKIISEALEYHAGTKEKERRDSFRGGSSHGSLETRVERSSRVSSIQLPPIQKGALDFMPISKEKEAILSRTRPSWLPPKDPKEERRHLKEYQRMMAASMEAEKKRRTKLQVQQCERDDTRESLNRIWHYYMDETTDITTIDTRVNGLCWRGISPNLRGKVWQRSIGNPLGLTVKSYEKALQRAKEIKRQPSDQLDRNDKSMGRWFVDIERDAETAFPELNLFQRNGPLWQDLVDVCEAYACYRSDVGYIYGIQLIAALLLLQLSTPADAFILLANCLNRPIPLAFQTNDTTTTGRTYNHAVSTVSIKFPRLHEYLFGSKEQGGLGFSGEEIFEPMLRTIFSNGLDVDRLCRVWDIWVFEGDRTLVRAAVAILGSLQSQLFDIRGDIDLKRRNIQEMLGWGPFNRQPHSGHWNLQAMGDEEKFVEEVRLAGTLDYTGK